MLRFALRRLLWVFPSVLGVSILGFFLLAMGASSAASQRAAGGSAGSQRSEYLDLPLFVNSAPRDVRARAELAVTALMTDVADGPHSSAASAELSRLGGAAFPVLLPHLDALAPEHRQRVTLALAPVAKRMGLDRAKEAGDPARSVLFFQRLWATRGGEFREATARSAVRRYVRYGTEPRARQLRVLDTFALPALFETLSAPEDVIALVKARRLVSVMAHVTGHDDRIAKRATVGEAAACVQRWQRWWMVHEADYVQLTGADRVAAFALETRYGKWVLEAIAWRFGMGNQGMPVLDELLKRARITLTILLLGVALCYLLAIPLATLSAAYRGHLFDGAVTGLMMVPYVASPAVLAVAVLSYGVELDQPRLLAACLLALALLAEPARHQRAAMLPVLTEEYIRAAVARGAGPLRVMFVHVLRNASLPLITRATVELPLALTACFVLEHAFGLDGIGAATVRAVAGHDLRWLMALIVTGAALAVTSLVIGDVLYAMADPRLVQPLVSGRRRPT